jgi:drug/metabolite transporter (DMT)-like permease
VIAVALGALVLGEPISPGLLAGGALILVAVILTTLRRPRRSSAAGAGRSEAGES